MCNSRMTTLVRLWQHFLDYKHAINFATHVLSTKQESSFK